MSRNHARKPAVAILAFAAAALCAVHAADKPKAEPPERSQARSVHLMYAPLARDADAAMVSTVVTEVQTNSYYMILGWDNGYCGLQDIDGIRAFIFSVWEPGNPFDFTAKEKDVPEGERARVLFAAQNVTVERFQHEGTGAKTIAGLDWKQGERVTVKVEAKRDGDDRIAFSCFIRRGASAEWLHFATISTLCKPFGNALISNIYSFIEDFWRNGHSQTLSRRAEFFNVVTRSAATGEWKKAFAARFTADGSANTNIDAGAVRDSAFFLATGGATKNDNAPLYSIIYLKNR
ncbi:MAG: DUF3472 domain-containing protein [Kiritimatiellae bacterium]|nr:DUF3472 domain-containing protein [Kiritimatiellia bacterium]